MNFVLIYTYWKFDTAASLKKFSFILVKMDLFLFFFNFPSFYVHPPFCLFFFSSFFLFSVSSILSSVSNVATKILDSIFSFLTWILSPSFCISFLFLIFFFYFFIFYTSFLHNVSFSLFHIRFSVFILFFIFVKFCPFVLICIFKTWNRNYRSKTNWASSLPPLNALCGHRWHWTALFLLYGLGEHRRQWHFYSSVMRSISACCSPTNQRRQTERGNELWVHLTTLMVSFSVFWRSICGWGGPRLLGKGRGWFGEIYTHFMCFKERLSL